METFDIARPSDSTRLDGHLKSAVPFTITNLAQRTIRARMEVRPASLSDRALFTIEGGNTRVLRPNDTVAIRVLIAATADTPSGSHTFLLKVVDEERPDDYFAESQGVEFLVAPGPGPKWKYWWLIPVAAVLLIAAGAGAWYLSKYPEIEDYHSAENPTRNVDVAMAALKRAGMEVTAQMTTLVTDPALNRMVVMQMNGDAPASGPARVERDTKIALEYTALMPIIKDLKKAAALTQLKNSGIGEELVDFSARQTLIPAEVDSVLEYAIVEHTDPADPSKPAGVRIAVTLGIPPTPVMVPDVMNQNYCAARNRLRALGFVIDGDPDGLPHLPPHERGLVRSQSPPPNTLLPPQSQVHLTYGGARLLCFGGVLRGGAVTDLRIFRGRGTGSN